MSQNLGKTSSPSNFFWLVRLCQQQLLNLIRFEFLLCCCFSVTFFLVLWFLVIKQDGVQPWEKFRLPRSLFPYHYEINLKPNLFPKDKKNIYWFNGSSRVYFVVSKSTDVILLQSKNLTYSDITLKSQVSILKIF